MEEILLKYEESVSELKEQVNQLMDKIGDQGVSKDLRDAFISFNREYKNYLLAIEQENYEKITEQVKYVNVYGLRIGQEIVRSNFSAEIKEQAQKLVKFSLSVSNLLDQQPLITYSLSKEEFGNTFEQAKDFRTLRKQLEQISQSQLAFDERIKKQLGESEHKAFSLETKLKELEENYVNKISEITQLYANELQNINEKKTQLDVVLGTVSSRVIAQDYETSAENEMKSANWLRKASLFCMFLIVLLVGYSFWQSIQTDFDLKSSIFRIILAFILSVPAAYLARESTKHRQKQYAHLQISLDLKAIDPYIASLPEEEQHKIKVDIANRMFGVNEANFQTTESYPINTHEIIMELIKKLELNKGK